MILIDAGPLVAIIHADDDHHAECTAFLETVEGPFVSVWPAVTEAMYLLGFSLKAQDALWEMLDRGFIRLLPLTADDVPRMRELMAKYKDLPMDLADAALVRVAERERIRQVFTTDRKDFEVYRPARLRHFTILPS